MCAASCRVGGVLLLPLLAHDHSRPVPRPRGGLKASCHVYKNSLDSFQADKTLSKQKAQLQHVAVCVCSGYERSLGAVGGLTSAGVLLLVRPLHWGLQGK